MLPSPDWAILTDPVCGRSVEATSPFRVVHGGALFAFCSPACREHFVELPSRYAVIASAIQPRRADAASSAPAPLTPDPPGSASAVAVPTVPAPPPARAAAPAVVPKPTPSPAPQPVAAAAPVAATGRTNTMPSANGRPTPAQPLVATAELPLPAAVAAGVPLPDIQELATAAGPFTWLLAWRERRFAATCAREMVRLHRELSIRFPELKGLGLYHRVVAARTGNATAADAVLERAEQSFAIWPVERALTFRDVVHYLAVSEFIATHSHARWVYADMKRIVDAQIPSHL